MIKSHLCGKHINENTLTYWGVFFVLEKDSVKKEEHCITIL